MFAVFVDQDSPRIRYVLEELLSRRWKTDLKIFTDIEAFKKNTSNFRIQYAEKEEHGLNAFFIAREPFLLENEVNEYFTPKLGSYHLSDKTTKFLQKRIKNQNIPKEEEQRMVSLLKEPFPCLFKNEGPLGFDVFSMVFYFLSRYEEYQNFEQDQWGRFQYNNSFVSEWDYNPSPFVDVAIVYLLGVMGALEHLKLPFEVIPTIDIDIAYRFHGRSIVRGFGSILRFPFQIPNKLISWISGKDPFDPNKTVEPFLADFPENAQVFWLCSKNTEGPNRQVLRGYKRFQESVLSMSRIFTTGVHPSLSKSNPLRDWKDEKHWLESTTSTKVENSRQHYLHLLFPHTYHILEKLGIKKDWSMGFAEHAGFRAGTSHPFRWFDLSKNKESSLVIHPFCIMDVTAKNYMKLNPDQAINMGRSLKEFVFIFGGFFTFIVHNESLSETEGWKGWNRVFNSWKNTKIEVASSLQD